MTDTPDWDRDDGVRAKTITPDDLNLAFAASDLGLMPVVGLDGKPALCFVFTDAAGRRHTVAVVNRKLIKGWASEGTGDVIQMASRAAVEDGEDALVEHEAKTIPTAKCPVCGRLLYDEVAERGICLGCVRPDVASEEDST